MTILYVQSIEPTTIVPLATALLPQYPVLDTEVSSYFSNISGFMSGPVSIYNLSSSLVGLPEDWMPAIDAFVHGLNHSDAAKRTMAWKNWSTTSKSLSNIREYVVHPLERGAFLQVCGQCMEASTIKPYHDDRVVWT